MFLLRFVSSAQSLLRVWCSAGLMLLAAAFPVAVPAQDSNNLHEQVMAIPLWDGAVPAALVATAYKPDGPGPFPVVILSHGSPGSAAERQRMGRYRVLSRIQEFVHRGFAVIVPMRRGYGDTGGPWAERYGSCEAPDFYSAGLEAAADLLAVIRVARTLPHVNPERIVLVGQSAGGFASIAAASRAPAGVIAVVNLSGGRAGNPRTHPGEPCASDRMALTIHRFAKTIRVPVLWHYAENDRFFGPAHVRAWFQAFREAGAPGTLVMRPPFGEDGHRIFASPSGLPIWTSAVDEFLRSIGMSYSARKNIQ